MRSKILLADLVIKNKKMGSLKPNRVGNNQNNQNHEKQKLFKIDPGGSNISISLWFPAIQPLLKKL